MDAEQYNKWSEPLKKHPWAACAVVRANKIITYLFYTAYPLLLMLLFATESSLAVRALLFPLIGFLLVTIVRAAVNQPRPYEALPLEPLIAKNTKGTSFPSRHAYSSMVIAVTFLNWCVFAGLPMIALALGMAALRVVGGVHYPHDVLVGTGMGILFGMLELL